MNSDTNTQANNLVFKKLTCGVLTFIPQDWIAMSRNNPSWWGVEETGRVPFLNNGAPNASTSYAYCKVVQIILLPLYINSMHLNNSNVKVTLWPSGLVY